MTVSEKIARRAAEDKAYVVEMRRTIHRFAETGGNEVKTGELIEREAKKLGLAVERVSGTGRLVTLDTGRPGNGVALRADIDALPVRENPENMVGPRTCVSDNPSTSHACGHDAHAAMLLCAMRILCELRDELCGRIYFCFERGEENGSGWYDMTAALKKRAVNTAFALHVSSALQSGKLDFSDGARLSGFIGVGVDILGRGGHGSRPDLSVNPVFCAAAILNNLAVAFANQIDANETVTLGITSIQGGSALNVIPDEARILGSMRYFSRAEGEKALHILKEVCGHTAAMNNCAVAYDPGTTILYEPTVNDPQAAAKARAWVAELLPGAVVGDTPPWFATESFSKYLERYKGAYGFLGVRNEEKGCCAEHHNERFDIDEDALPAGVTAYAQYAARALFDADIAAWGYTTPKGGEGPVPPSPAPKAP